MDLIKKELKKLLDSNQHVEKQASVTTKNFALTIKSLLQMNERFKQLEEQVSKNNDSEQLVELIKTSIACNESRREMIADRHANKSSTMTAEQTSELDKKLSDNLQRRLKLVQQLYPKELDLQKQLMSQLTAYMHTEDATLIHLLMAISYADGKIHKKESKLISQHFKEITLRTPDKETLDAGFALIDSKLETVLEQLTDHSLKMTSSAKRAMFFSAIEVAAADNELHVGEEDILLKTATALGIIDNDGKPLTSKQTLLDIVERRSTIG